MQITKPSISVIVIAHDRHNFLQKAIESLLEQTVNRDLFEVIVVKNFKDQAIDSLIEKSGFSNVLTYAGTSSQKFSVGIERSNGEIIAFLEDDDFFAPEKLGIMLKQFNLNKNLGYFHNSHYPVDVNGNLTTGLWKKQTQKAVMLKIDELSEIDVKRAFNMGFHFNASSIAVKREVILPYIDNFKKIDVVIDDFLFYCSLKSNLALMNSPENLTYYRVHDSDSNPLGRDKISREKYKSHLIKGYEDLILLGKIFDIPAVRQIIKCSQLEFRILLFASMRDDTYGVAPDEILKFCNCMMSRNKPYQLIWAVFAFIRKLSPKLSNFILQSYYELRN